jgi:hypothetical protein
LPDGFAVIFIIDFFIDYHQATDAFIGFTLMLLCRRRRHIIDDTLILLRLPPYYYVTSASRPQPASPASHAIYS